jgi:hypothetical protein
MSATVSEALQRLQRMVDDPAGYFDEARRESESVVRSEMTNSQRRTGSAPRKPRAKR